MKYAVTLKWNGTVCLEARATSVWAYEILKRFSENFANPVKVNFVLPSLDDLAYAPTGKVFRCRAKEDDARGEYLVIAYDPAERVPLPTEEDVVRTNEIIDARLEHHGLIRHERSMDEYIADAYKKPRKVKGITPGDYPGTYRCGLRECPSFTRSQRCARCGQLKE